MHAELPDAPFRIIAAVCLFRLQNHCAVRMNRLFSENWQGELSFAEFLRG